MKYGLQESCKELKITELIFKAVSSPSMDASLTKRANMDRT